MADGSHNFGGIPPSYSVVEILLYCLQVTVSNWTCTYISGSGTYTSYSSIGSFISDLEAGTLPAPDSPLPPFGPGDAPPDIVITKPGYIVVVLSSSDQPSLCFQLTPMTTGMDCSSKYYSLTEPYTGSDGKPRVLYFSVPVVAPTSQHVDDAYTLFLQYKSNGSTVNHSIDPALKNRGGGG